MSDDESVGDAIPFRGANNGDAVEGSEEEDEEDEDVYVF